MLDRREVTAVIATEAERRYHTDAEFHAEVYEAVEVALATYPFLSESERQFAKGHATLAAAVALHRREVTAITNGCSCTKTMAALIAYQVAIAEAVAELDANHRMDGATRPMCVMCGTADGSWPCASRMVADDLRAALGSGS